MSTLTKQINTVALSVGLVATVIMAFGLGIGEVGTVLLNPDEAEANTTLAFGGDISVLDRVATAGLVIGALVAIGGSTVLGNSPAIRALTRNYALIVGLIGFTQFSTEVTDILQGNFDYAIVSDERASYLVAIAMMTVAGFIQILGLNRNN